MTKGIILIAAGHHYYGRMAYNLALTVKAKDKSLPIALVYTASALIDLVPKQLAVFDHKIELEGDWREIRFKIPEITPFTRTLFMDVDTVWIKDNPAAVFNILDTTDFACVNEGYFDLETKQDHSKPYTWGGNLEDIIHAYKLTKGKLWKIRGEFILFKKTKKVTTLFKKAGEFCKAPKISLHHFAGGNPTEWAFDVAMNKMHIDCHKANWQPTYWPLVNGGRMPELYEINQAYFALSTGGALIKPKQKIMYDRAVEAACFTLGLKKNLFPLQPKIDFLPERKLNNAKVVI